MHYPQCKKWNHFQILMHKHSYFSLLCLELILVCCHFPCFWLHKIFCSCISRELVAGALMQFPMIFQQAATRLSALCMCLCVLYSAVWECPVSPMSYCTLTLSNKTANPSVQPAPSSDFYWPNVRSDRFVGERRKSWALLQSICPNRTALLYLSLIQIQVCKKNKAYVGKESFPFWMH